MTNQVATLRMEQKFKKTPAGEIPVDWGVTTFRDSFDFLRTANNSRDDLSPTDTVGYIHYGDIHTKWRTRLQCDCAELPKINQSKVEGIPNLQNGDLVMADASEDYDGIGVAVEVCNIGNRQIVAGLHTLLLRDKGGVFADGFRGYIQYMPAVRQNLIKVATGVSVYGLSKGNLSGIPIPRPPLDEQRKIAEILSAMDECIDKTDAAIERLRHLKAGVLQRFFGDGKRVEKIPKGWKILPLIQVSTLQRGVDLPVQSRRAGDVPVYGSSGILGYHDETEFKGPGVITGRSGTIGQVYFCEGSYWPLNTTLHVVDFHGNDPRFIGLLLSFLRLERFTASTGVPSLNRNFVHPMPVAVPPLKDQEHLVTIIEHCDRQVGVEEAILRSAEALHNGLMQALLAGTVRTIR